MDFRKSTTSKRLIWKSLESASDSTRPPPLHLFLVPQLTTPTLKRTQIQLLPLSSTCGGPGGEERPVYLHCAMFKGLEHCTSRVTWQIKTKVDVSGIKSNRGSILRLCRWDHSVPVHAIWSLSGWSPPVHRKWSVTATSALLVVMPSACNAWLMHPVLCKEWVSEWNVTSVKSAKM